MYKRPGRRVWYASLDDRQKHISLGTEDEDRAREKFADLVKQRGGSVPLDSDEKRLTDLWEETRRRADTNNTPKTAYSLHLNLRRIVTWLEARGVHTSRQIDQQIVEDYKTARRFDGVSAARINRELDSWRRMMKLGVELGVTSERVLGYFKKLREPRPQPNIRGLTKAELTRFLRAVQHPGYRALFRTVLGCGIRDDEMRHMDARDLQPPCIVVTPKPGWTTKGYRYRAIPVTKATVTAARTYLKARVEGLNVDQKKVWTVMQEACVAARVRPFSMHDLRRAWASHMLAAGNRIEQISRWLGHADVMTTMRYLRIVDEVLPTKDKLPW